jgi:WD40 repeat protein/HEAT repeat protein
MKNSVFLISQIIAFCIYCGLYTSCNVQGNLDSQYGQYDWSIPHETFTLSGHTGEITYVTYSADGKQVLSLSIDSTARIWDVETGKISKVLEGHNGAVRAAVFLEDRLQIKTYADDHNIKIWDLETGLEVSSKSLPSMDERVISAAFSPDGSRLALGLKARAEVYDANNGELLCELSPFGHPGLRVNIMDIGFSIDGERIVTASYSHEVGVWKTGTGERILNLHEHGSGCLTAKFNKAMTKIASGARDHCVIIWDARLGTIVKKLEIGWEVGATVFNPNGSTLLVLENVGIDENSRLALFDLHTYKKIVDLSEISRIRSAAFSPDGAQFLISAGNNIKIYEAAVGGKIIQQEFQEKENRKIELSQIDKAAELNQVAYLIDIALRSQNGELWIRTVKNLSKSNINITQVIKMLSDSLDSRNEDIRVNAAITLAELGAAASGAKDPLINLLEHDNNAKVRAVAALALGCIGVTLDSPIAMNELIKSLKDRDVRVRYHAAHALDKMRYGVEAAQPALTEVVLSDSSTGLRRQIAFNLGNAGEVSLGALPRLIKGTSSNDERERWWACYTLWCITSSVGEAAKVAIPSLKKALNDPSDYRDENGGPPYKYAIYAMGGIGPIVKKTDPEIIAILEDIMENDKEYYQRKAAAIALENILEIKGLRQKVRGYKKRAS